MKRMTVKKWFVRGICAVLAVTALVGTGLLLKAPQAQAVVATLTPTAGPDATVATEPAMVETEPAKQPAEQEAAEARLPEKAAPTEPKAEQSTEPKTEAPIKSEEATTRPTQPKPEEPAQPKPEEPAQPKPVEPTQPEPVEPTQPEPEEPTQPEETQPSVPDTEEMPQSPTVPDTSGLTEAQKTAEARAVAESIAYVIMNDPTVTTDIERIAYAARFVHEFVKAGHTSSFHPDRASAYGTFVAGYSNCAGSTRAMGMVLECMGFKWKHVNENQNTHQWCIVYDVDGQTGFADGSSYGIVGYGSRNSEANWRYMTNQGELVYYREYFG